MNWMDQAGGLFKQWADQQQTLFRGMATGSRNVRCRHTDREQRSGGHE